MRRAAKVDDNQAEIVGALRKMGCSVQLLHSIGKGCPDILVGFEGMNFLFEIKMKKGKLTSDQEVWIPRWRGQVAIGRNAEEIMMTISMHLAHTGPSH